LSDQQILQSTKTGTALPHEASSARASVLIERLDAALNHDGHSIA